MDDSVRKALEGATQLVQDAATKMAEVGPEAWKVIVWQATAEGIATILYSLVVIVGVFLIRREILRIWPAVERKEDRWENEDFWIRKIFEGGSVFLCAVIALVQLGNVTEGIIQVVNPSFYAIKMVLGLVK